VREHSEQAGPPTLGASCSLALAHELESLRYCIPCTAVGETYREAIFWLAWKKAPVGAATPDAGRGLFSRKSCILPADFCPPPLIFFGFEQT